MAISRVEPPHDALLVRLGVGEGGLGIDSVGPSCAQLIDCLVRICQYVRLPDGTRTAEALATGIPTVLSALRNADLPAPIFDDDGLRFTVVLRQRPLIRANTIQPQSSRARILVALGTTTMNIDQLHSETGLAPANLRKHLRALRDEGLVTQQGGQGQRATYTRTDT